MSGSGSRLRPYLGPLVALLVVLALGAGTVYAAIPNGSGTYYACLTKSSGVVRLINYPKVKCATGERFIKWSQQGPAGPAGGQGAQGLQGERGLQGLPGEAGITKITLTKVVSNNLQLLAGTSAPFIFPCPAGRPTGGGFYTPYPDDLEIFGSMPSDAGTGWKVWAKNTGTETRTLVVWVQCMTTDPGTVIAKLSPAAKKALATASKGAGNKKGN